MLGTSCPPTSPFSLSFCSRAGLVYVQLTFDLRWGRVLLQLDGDDLLDNPGEAQSAFYEGPGVSGSGAGGGLQAPSHLPSHPQWKPVGRRPQGRREGSRDTHPHDALCWAEGGRQSESRVGEVGPLLLEHPGWALAWGGPWGSAMQSCSGELRQMLALGFTGEYSSGNRPWRPVPAQLLGGDPVEERDQLIWTSVSI